MAASASEASLSEIDLARCSAAAADEQWSRLSIPSKAGSDPLQCDALSISAVVICFNESERNDLLDTIQHLEACGVDF
jgi:hypothetical protein